MIFGITGTNGAGKGTVVDYLVGEKGFTHYSSRILLSEEVEKRGMVLDRSSMHDVANDLRATKGPAYLAETFYNRAIEKGGDGIIDSIRAIKEAEFLKSKGAYLIAVDADRKIRYERVVARGSATDKVDFDTWVVQEEREWGNTEAHDMNVPAVMKMADFTISNSGTLEDLYAQIDKMFWEIAKK